MARKRKVEIEITRAPNSATWCNRAGASFVCHHFLQDAWRIPKCCTRAWLTISATPINDPDGVIVPMTCRDKHYWLHHWPWPCGGEEAGGGILYSAMDNMLLSLILSRMKPRVPVYFLLHYDDGK